MDVGQLLTGSKWDILTELAKTPQSTSELATLLGTSQPNISQQLRQLELAGLVERRRSPSANVHYRYHIKTQMGHIIHLGPQTAEKETVQLDPHQQLLVSLFTHPHGITISTFCLAHPELFSRIKAIGILPRKDAEIFIIADRVDDIRKDFSDYKQATIAGDKKLVLWSHTETETIEGLERKDAYYAKSLNDLSVVYDPEGVLSNLRQKMEDLNE